MDHDAVRMRGCGRFEAEVQRRRIVRKDKGGVSPPLSFCGFARELLHVYFDLPRFDLFRFRHADFENAVFVGSFDALRFRGLGQ